MIRLIYFWHHSGENEKPDGALIGQFKLIVIFWSVLNCAEINSELRKVRSEQNGFANVPLQEMRVTLPSRIILTASQFVAMHG